MTYLAKPTPRPKERKPLKARPHVIPLAIRERVFERDEWLCQFCRFEGGSLDAHHRLPRSRGGRDEYDCLVSVHRRCHQAIHDRPAESYARGFLVHSADELGKGWT
jgi:5-methylcytosine-specific restriction endonuclease McrA